MKSLPKNLYGLTTEQVHRFARRHVGIATNHPVADIAQKSGTLVVRMIGHILEIERMKHREAIASDQKNQSVETDEAFAGLKIVG